MVAAALVSRDSLVVAAFLEVAVAPALVTCQLAGAVTPPAAGVRAKGISGQSKASVCECTVLGVAQPGTHSCEK